MRRPKTDAAGVEKQIQCGQSAHTDCLWHGGKGGTREGFPDPPPLEATLPQVPLCSPSFRRIKHRINLRKIHMTVMWLCGGEEKTGCPPAQPCSSTWADQGIGPAFRAVADWAPRALRSHWERGGGMIGGVNNLNSIPVPVTVPLVHHHFPLPLILNPPPPKLACTPPLPLAPVPLSPLPLLLLLFLLLLPLLFPPIRGVFA